MTVEPYFRDPDGDRLIYLASSNNGSIVRPEVSGSTVVLIPVATGKARVTITARDPGGLTALQTMEVAVSANRPPELIKPFKDLTIKLQDGRRSLEVGVALPRPGRG